MGHKFIVARIQQRLHSFGLDSKRSTDTVVRFMLPYNPLVLLVLKQLFIRSWYFYRATLCQRGM